MASGSVGRLDFGENEASRNLISQLPCGWNVLSLEQVGDLRPNGLASRRAFLQSFERLSMHVLRPQFRIEEQRALVFAAERGFGVIVAADERGPRGSHVPFVIARRDDRVIVQIHLTARNPLVELADGVRRFLLIVAGDDAYIANDWYA